jgi:hypothetical protein
MNSTIYLDPATWDMTVDASGNIAKAAAPYALAQDVASAIKLFQGELWFDQSRGVPYFQDPLLGTLPPASLLRQRLTDAALTVPNVETAQCIIEGLADRTVSGAVLFIDSEGVSNGVSFN